MERTLKTLKFAMWMTAISVFMTGVNYLVYRELVMGIGGAVQVFVFLFICWVYRAEKAKSNP